MVDRYPISERFWPKVDSSGGPNACWPWTSRCDKDGYGRCQRNGVNDIAHRIAYELTCGPIPKGAYVLHECDNPPCCNPAHLHLGDAKKNAEERKARGRSAVGDRSGARLHPELWKRGEAHMRTTITTADVIAIRQRRAAGEMLKDLASDYGMSISGIHSITTRITWKHVP